MQSEELKPCPMCGADEASTYMGAPGPGVVTCFAVGCGHTIKGFASDSDAITEWNKRSDAMSAAMTEAYCSEGTDDDTLKECFLHHVRTTIGFLAFGMRTGPEMTMYEEGFKAGYRRCQSDNEPELGEDDDDINERTRNVVAKLRESLKNGAVDHLAIDNAVDLLIDQSKAITCLSAEPQPAPLAAVRALHKAASDFMHLFIQDGQLTVQGLEDTDLIPAYEKLSAALSAQVQDAAGWQPIETAPKDGTPILGYGEEPCRRGGSHVRETRWEFYGEGSIAKERFKRGEGPSGSWGWQEPIHNWASSWEPTHWMPLPSAPAAPAKQEGGTND